MTKFIVSVVASTVDYRVVVEQVNDGVVSQWRLDPALYEDEDALWTGLANFLRRRLIVDHLDGSARGSSRSPQVHCE